VTITFSGPSANASNTLLALDGSSDAQGAGVGITDPNGSAVVLGKASAAVQLMDVATNSLVMYGYLQGLGDDTKLKEGNFQAASSFTLAYQ
jgi:Fimbrial protein.